MEAIIAIAGLVLIVVAAMALIGVGGRLVRSAGRFLIVVAVIAAIVFLIISAN